MRRKQSTYTAKFNPENPGLGELNPGISGLEKCPGSRDSLFVRKVTHVQKQNPWADRDELLHRCGVHDVITFANFMTPA